MQSFIVTLLTCSITMSALALLYIAITPFMAKHYSEKCRYYTWLIIVIGFIIPFRPQWGRAIVKVDMPRNTVAPIMTIGNRAPVIIPFNMPDKETAPVSATQNTSWWLIVLAIWLIGMVTFLAFNIIKHYRFMKFVNRWSEKVTGDVLVLFQNLKIEMGITKQIDLSQSSCVSSPMMIGLVKPCILLPAVVLAQDELRFILKHELVHYKRRDLLYKYLVLIATAVHWFNPVVYLLSRAVGLLCEMSCDTEVVRNTDVDTRQSYSETIIGIVKYKSTFTTALSTNFYGGKRSMKNRITSIMDASSKKMGIVIIIIALVITLGTGIVIFAEVSQDGIRYYADKTGKIDMLPNDEIGNVLNDGSPHEAYVSAASQTTINDDGEEITEYFEPEIGYINADGEMVPYGYTNLDGEWIPLGYVDENGDWVATGYKDVGGRWVLYENENVLQKATGLTDELSKHIEEVLQYHNITYTSINASSNPIIAGMDTHWQAFDLVCADGETYVLILRKSIDGKYHDDYTALLDSDGRMLDGIIDNWLIPALFENGVYIFGEHKRDIVGENGLIINVPLSVPLLIDNETSDNQETYENGPSAQLVMEQSKNKKQFYFDDVTISLTIECPEFDTCRHDTIVDSISNNSIEFKVTENGYYKFIEDSSTENTKVREFIAHCQVHNYR